MLAHGARGGGRRALLAAVLLMAAACRGSYGAGRGAADDCSPVERHFISADFGGSAQIPSRPVHDGDMQICYNGDEDLTHTSCCTRHMERKYNQAAERDFFEVTRATSSYLKNLLTSNMAQYQEQFLEMIHLSENQTETLFIEVYKIPYRIRRGPLETLYLDLEAYIRRREVNLHETVSQFFDELFPLVFHNIMNDPDAASLSEDYRECLTEIRQELYPRPFGGVPNRLAHQLSKSMIAAKTFLEGLGLGIEAINTTDHLQLDPECSHALTRLRYCSVCEGHLQARPCRNFCYNVMRGCLATIGEIDRHWNEFVNSLKALTSYMNGYYNIETMMHNLHTRISEAVLHAMESGHKFYTQVVEKCGHPKAVDDGSPVPTLIQKPLGIANAAAIHEPIVNFNLYSTIETFMRSLMASKGFYHSFSDTVCSAEKFATGLNQDNCWTGEDIGRYNKTLIGVDLEAQMRSNPEMTVAPQETASVNALIDKLIHVKKLMASKVSSEMMQADEGYRPRKNRQKNKNKNNQQQYFPSEGSGTSTGNSDPNGHMDDEDWGGNYNVNVDDEDYYEDGYQNGPYDSYDGDNQQSNGGRNNQGRKNKNRGRNNNKKNKKDRNKGYYGYGGSGDDADGGKYDDHIDDEDYSVDGSGAEGGYTRHDAHYGSGAYQPKGDDYGPKVKQRPGYNTGNDHETDIYIEDDRPTANSPSASRDAASSITCHLGALLTTTMLGLALWLNG